MPNNSSKNPNSPKRGDFPPGKGGTAAHRHAYYEANKGNWKDVYSPAEVGKRKILTRRARIVKAEDIELDGNWDETEDRTRHQVMLMPPEKMLRFGKKVLAGKGRIV